MKLWLTETIYERFKITLLHFLKCYHMVVLSS